MPVGFTSSGGGRRVLSPYDRADYLEYLRRRVQPGGDVFVEDPLPPAGSSTQQAAEQTRTPATPSTKTPLATQALTSGTGQTANAQGQVAGVASSNPQAGGSGQGYGTGTSKRSDKLTYQDTLAGFIDAFEKAGMNTDVRDPWFNMVGQTAAGMPHVWKLLGNVSDRGYGDYVAGWAQDWSDGVNTQAWSIDDMASSFKKLANKDTLIATLQSAVSDNPNANDVKNLLGSIIDTMGFTALTSDGQDAMKVDLENVYNKYRAYYVNNNDPTLFMQYLHQSGFYEKWFGSR